MARKSKIKVKLEHKMPIFVDEYYAIKLTIENNEENSIENIWFVFWKNSIIFTMKFYF